jgi:type I restriction enzyme S subunit
MRKGYLNEKLGGIPNGWRESLMPEISWFQEGPGLRKWQFKEEGIKVINITNMVDGVLDLSRTSRHISWEEFNSTYTHFECQENDIVVASSGNSYCKHAIVRKQDLPLVMNTSVIRFKPLEGTSYEFLNQFLKSSLFKEQIDFMITGGAQPNFGPVHLNKVVLAIPLLPEQQKIAKILSTVDEKIENIEQQITATEQLKKGLMQCLLTKGIGHTEFKDSPLGEIPKSWEVKLVDDVAKRGTGHTPNKQFSEYYNGGVKWVSLGDSKKLDNRFIAETKIEISQEGINNSSAVLHPEGTVLLSRDAGIGKSAVMKCDMAVSQHFITWQCRDALNNWYLYYSLQLLKPTFERVAIGSTIKTIGLGFFKKLKLAIPPKEEQDKIAAILYMIDEKIKLLKDKMDAQQELKKGLMQQLLTGKIRVKHG